MNNIYEVDHWNNFCYVFEVPQSFPSEFLFGGGKPVSFLMVDWFYPISQEIVGIAAVSKEVWRKEVGEIIPVPINLLELEETMRPFILSKNYTRPGYRYLVLYEFGAVSLFTRDD